MNASDTAPDARVVVGGVAHLYQGDLDLGRHAVERLAREPVAGGVVVEEFSYGAVAVAQRLEELRPDALVLVAAKERGRQPGTVERREIAAPTRAAAEAQAAIGEAVTGYIDIDLVVDVAQAFGALPTRTVAIEVEPESTEPAEQLTPTAEAALAEALALVRDEVSRFSAVRLG